MRLSSLSWVSPTETLDQVIRRLAQQQSCWVLIEHDDIVVTHAPGPAPAPQALQQTVLERSTRALRKAVRWQRSRIPLRGTCDTQKVTAHELENGFRAWFVGQGWMVDSSLHGALVAALDSHWPEPHDTLLAEMLHPQGISLSRQAPSVVLVAIETTAPRRLAFAFSREHADIRVHQEVFGLVLALPPTADPNQVLEPLRRATPAVGGIVPVAHGAHDWRDTIALARDAAEAARNLNLPWGDVREARVLAQVLQARARQVMLDICASLDLDPLAALRAADEGYGGELSRSLRAWLDSQLDNGAAAQQRRVHPNTMRYRLRRARELSGTDSHDMGMLATVHLLLERQR